ncbi:hypothetical protein LIER_12652 [Lithospermum erythrorhizon]|uniref:Uncharacterized protein n=1 Tax=Lithospermum erythrorhizon TaxID=34254 RepID=A0AAV3PT91_LITER
MSNIGPHWPQLVREFICNVLEEITDPASPMFHKVKLRGHVFKFSPTLINKYYGFRDEVATEATLKLGDIIEELIGKALSVWPTKGNQPEPVPEGEVAGMLLRVYEEELLRVETEIQAKTVIASELKSKIHALKSRVPPAANGSTVNPVLVATTSANPPGDETSTFHV